MCHFCDASDVLANLILINEMIVIPVLQMNNLRLGEVLRMTKTVTIYVTNLKNTQVYLVLKTTLYLNDLSRTA